jgi:Uma2 family endonuclease
LFGWAEQDGSGYALGSGVGYTLMDSSVRSANASWISAQRWTPDDEDEEASVLAPDFVIELRSKTDRLKTAQEKMQSWIANGVQLGWLIDPQRRLVEIYRRGETEPTILSAPASVAGEAAVAGFVLELESIWGKG